MKQPAGVLIGRELTKFLLLAILVRLVRDTGVRMMYPFLPAYAAGLGVTLTAMGVLLSLRNGAILLAPYFGHLSDRGGPRRLLLFGFGLLALGMTVMGWANGMVMAAAAFVLLGLSDAINTALMQAYVSDHSPVAMRGRALAIVEYAWAITGIALLPLVGWLIAAVSWQTPFRLMGLAAVAAMLLLAFAMPGDPPRSNRPHLTLRTQMAGIVRDRSAFAAVLASGLVFIAVETVFVVWGAHLERRFGFDPAQIGGVAVIIGLAELGGSVLSSLIIDKTGKRRGTTAGVLAFIFILALMPWLDRSLALVVTGLALASMCLEYTVVSSIPLLGQQRPGSRASVFAMGVMMAAMTRGATDAVATWLFENVAFLAAMGYALIALVGSAWLLWRRVEERAEA
ncbi:MAG: MFS transporter [Caldilineales bacterium]|nr:MFS transporter [Caldilineales bacterium]